ncbi:MAG: thiol-disulfide oxidoreductase [Chlorobiaceae bacterium]|nr:thiol-disulfide oxidoreductase [Chlorobiaceae bacterium]MBA4308949.1 thiol-disulfide oxidoreductase [Chlorobiaceae bacterium]
MKMILYDHKCNLCNSIISFILKHDSNKKFIYISLWSDESKIIMESVTKQTLSFDTFYLIDAKVVYSRSTAFFHVLKELKTPWKLLLFFQFLPTKVLDFIYDFVAQNRYRFNKKQHSCNINSNL